MLSSIHFDWLLPNKLRLYESGAVHSQINLTMNTYAHIVPDLMRDAAERMQRALEKPGRSDV
jgi:hypothetical protein